MNNYKYRRLIFLAFAIALASSCNKKEKQRSDGAQSETEVRQESQRKIDATAIRAPEGTTIEVAVSGLSYPVGVTFDERGTMYIAEAGGHTYGTKPGRAPDARIMKRNLDGRLTILYDQVVPMNEVKA